MKLRVVELLLVSTLPAMVLAEKGLPSFGLTIATIVAGTLAAGSANAFNMVIESDLDKLMERTSKRPLVTGQISKSQATIFAALIGFIALALFWIFTTTLGRSHQLTFLDCLGIFLRYLFLDTAAFLGTSNQV